MKYGLSIEPAQIKSIALNLSTSSQLVLSWTIPDASNCIYIYSVNAYAMINPGAHIAQSISGTSGTNDNFSIFNCKYCLYRANNLLLHAFSDIDWTPTV